MATRKAPCMVGLFLWASVSVHKVGSYDVTVIVRKFYEEPTQASLSH